MKKLWIASLIVLIGPVFLILNCEMEGESYPEPSDDVVNATIAAFAPVAEWLGADDQAAVEAKYSAIDFSVSVDETQLTVVFDNYTESVYGYTVNGTITLTKTVQVTTGTISLSGSLALSGGTISSLEFNVSATGTWDSVEDDFSDDPTFTGTVTANGTAYDINDFTFLFEDPEEGGIVTDPRYLASGMSAIVYSADGSAWGWPNVSQGADIANAANLYGIACDGSGHCVAVGDSGTILYSTNGITWTKKTSGTTEQLNNVTYANSTWVAVGEDGSVLSSSDGSTWTLQTTFPPTARLFGVAYGNERWVVAGQTLVQYSADLEEWTDVMPAAAPWRDVATDGAGNWVIVGEGGMRYYSNDNASSFTAASPSIPEHLWSVTYGNGRFIAVGQGGMGWGGETPIITYSDDSGASWSGNVVPWEYAAGAMRPFHDTATNGAGIWAAIGGGGDHLLSTDNGTTWQVIALEKYGVFSVAYRP